MDNSRHDAVRLRLNVVMKKVEGNKYRGGFLRWKLMIIWLLIIWFWCKFIVKFSRQNEDRIIHEKTQFSLPFPSTFFSTHRPFLLTHFNQWNLGNFDSEKGSKHSIFFYYFRALNEFISLMSFTFIRSN